MTRPFAACSLAALLCCPGSDARLATCERFGRTPNQLYCSAGYGDVCPEGTGLIQDATSCWSALLLNGFEVGPSDPGWDSAPAGCFVNGNNDAVFNSRGGAGLPNAEVDPVCVQCAARQVGLCPAGVCSRIAGMCSPTSEAPPASETASMQPLPSFAVPTPPPFRRNAPPAGNAMPVGGSTWAPAPPWGQTPMPIDTTAEDAGVSPVMVAMASMVGLCFFCGALAFFVVKGRPKGHGKDASQKQKLYMDDGASSSDEPDPEKPLIVPMGMKVPSYWTNKDLRLGFDTREDVPIAVEKTIQAMLDGCWRNVQTRDRKGPIPTRLEVSAVHRVEDAKMWVKYQQTKAQILKSRGGSCTPVHHLDGDTATGFVKTMDESYRKTTDFCDGLNANANEFFLFHGTSPDGALGISEDGFRISMAGSNAGTMFGKGAYFAECSSKADEYSTDGQGIYKGIFGLLVCRVTCGEMLRVTRSNLPQIEKALDSKSVDAVLGDREASVGTYREFIVFKERMVYPEYVVLYKRRVE